MLDPGPETDYLFLIYAKENAEQTYRFYVGENTDFDPATIQMVQANVATSPTLFQNVQPLPAGRTKWLNDNKATAKGVVEVLLKVSDFPDVAKKYKDARQKKCQPATYCTWKADAETCVDATGSDAVCRWAIARPECPDGGCIGIAFTLPAGFKPLATLRSRAPRRLPAEGSSQGRRLQVGRVARRQEGVRWCLPRGRRHADAGLLSVSGP